MSPAPFARTERAALCDLFLAVGPDAPTLCGEWTTRDLAAHLVMREGRPDAAPGIIFGPLAGYAAKVQHGIADQPWEQLVRTVRQGPPRWSPQSIERLDVESNTVEFFVHHEDVRRAAPGWVARQLPANAADDLWPRVGRVLALVLRKSPVGVVVEPTDGPEAGSTVTLRKGDRTVTLAGPVSEIVLSLFGRPTSGLEVSGDPADVQAFLEFPR